MEDIAFYTRIQRRSQVKSRHFFTLKRTPPPLSRRNEHFAPSNNGILEPLTKAALVLLSVLYVPIITKASLEAREVTKDDVELDGDTAYFSIVYCLPNSYEVDGNTITLTVDDEGTSSWKPCSDALRSFLVSSRCHPP
jgi:hypothetical protein